MEYKEDTENLENLKNLNYLNNLGNEGDNNFAKRLMKKILEIKISEDLDENEKQEII